MNPLDDTTRRSTSHDSALRHLVLVWNNGFQTAPLPEQGEIILGRGPNADISIAHDSVSRRHALLRITPGALPSIQDLHSENGTRVGSRMLAPDAVTPLAPNALVQVGEVFVVLRGVHEPPDPSLSSAPQGASSMGEIHRVLDLVAVGNIAVTLVGETGVGKERLAERVHERSPRAKNRFLRINCAALPETLLESELFGYERGAFTGANGVKQGLLESANGGTVFLDEIGELPLSVQAKLLRVLESKQSMRVGSLLARDIDVRFVAATNRDLEAMVREQTFRKDLYFRLGGIVVTVPPLRERIAEIEPLAREFLDDAFRQVGKHPAPCEHTVFDRLRAYDWPGNIRELRNTMECAALLCTDGEVTLSHLPPRLRELAQRAPAAAPQSLRDTLDGLERERILAVLAECGGNRTRAARRLGISRQTLTTKLDAYGVVRPRKTDDE